MFKILYGFILANAISSLNNQVTDQSMQEIKGTQIKNLITKFYYKENQMCFQLLIHTESEQTINYKEYSDYSEFKMAYDKLLKAKSENTGISLPVSSVNSTHMNFA